MTDMKRRLKSEVSIKKTKPKARHNPQNFRETCQLEKSRLEFKNKNWTFLHLSDFKGVCTE